MTKEDVLDAIKQEVKNRDGGSIIDPSREGYDSWSENYEVSFNLTIKEIRVLLGLPK